MTREEKERIQQKLHRAADAHLNAYGGNLYYEGVARGLEQAAGIVGKTKCVDAVEVVRCKDCRHWVGKHRSQCPVKCKTFGYCDLWEQYAGNGEKFFCAYGERRETDETD